MASMPPSKLPRTEQRDSSLAQLKYSQNVSQAAMAKILSESRKLELLNDGNVVSFDIIKRAGEKEVQELVHTETFPLCDKPGKTFRWEFMHCSRLLTSLVRSSRFLQFRFAAALERTPSSLDRPWSLILAFDEFTAGQTLQPHPGGKTMAISFTFAELGRDAWYDEKQWLSPAFCRHNMAVSVEGGYSHMFRRFLRHMLLGSSSFTLAGVPIPLPGGRTVLLFAKLARILADGEGLAIFYEWRGAGSIRCCLRHFNVTTASLAQGGFVGVSCHDPAKFQSYTKADFRQIAATVVDATARNDDGRLSDALYEKTKKAVGFNCSELGVLHDGELAEVADFAQAITFDWVHTLLQDGVITDEVQALLVTSGITIERLREWLLQDWRFPRHLQVKGSNLYAVFEDKRSSEARIRHNCSEMLGLYTLLRFYVETEVPISAALAKARQSFMAACTLVDCILAFKRGHDTFTVDSLDRIASRWMKAHVEAYGTELLKPKSHYVFDVCEQIRRDNGRVFDCFVVERMHQRAKQPAQRVADRRRYERFVASAVYFKMRDDCADAHEVTLQGRLPQLDVWPAAELWRHASVSDHRLTAGDFVFHGQLMGEVLACARDGEELFALALIYKHVARVSKGASKWAKRGDNWVVAFRLLDVTAASAWLHNAAHTEVTVIV